MIALQGKLSLAGIDEKVLFWGLLSAVAVAIYSVQPVSLLRRYGTGPIVGFAMLFSGIIITPWAKPFDVPVNGICGHILLFLMWLCWVRLFPSMPIWKGYAALVP